MNDTYGHAVGDQILKAIGGILNSQVRTTDVVGRYGGEEFLVILADTNHDGAELALERILKAICSAQHDIGREQPLEVTVSIGFSTHSKDRPFEDAKALVHAADQALYAAKANGRNCCVTPDLEVIS